LAIACALCDSVGRGERWRAPRFCMRTRVDPPGACWLHSSTEELRWCAQSMVTSMQGADKRNLYLQLLRRVGEAFQHDDLAVDNLLATMSPEERSMLLKYGSVELRAVLSKRIAALPNAEVRPATTSARIPDGLPQPLLDGLLAFEKRLQARYETLVERGHTRSHKYVAAAMKVPVRLAVFLAGEGIERWDVVRKRDLVAFFQKHPAAPRQPIERFLQSMEDHRPFRDRRGRPAGGRKRMRDAKRRPPPQVLRPEILAHFLADVRERYSVHEYVLAWMVCRLGMIARHAYSITMDRIQLNDRGRMVIRPALVWVEVPPRVADQFRKIIEPVEPSWGKVDPESLRHAVRPLHHQARRLLGDSVAGAYAPAARIGHLCGNARRPSGSRDPATHHGRVDAHDPAAGAPVVRRPPSAAGSQPGGGQKRPHNGAGR
jgi:hypothetical protein